MVGVVIAAAVLTVMLLMYARLQELTSQLTYLQDTTNIILSDVGGMQSNIEKTLKEEASMVESYSMEISDMDFAGHTYGVDVSVIPKEYSEKTKVSVYFGTVECPLKLDGYAYTGSVRLPLGKSFEGNVTFLLANGKKKSTEVLEDYDGLCMNLSDVLSGKLEDAPTCRDNTLTLKSDCSIVLDGGKQFLFDEARLVAELDEKEIYSQDLFADLKEQQEEQKDSLPDGQQPQQPVTEERTVGTQLPVNSFSSNVSCHFTYDMGENPDGENLPEGSSQTAEVPSDHHIRLYLEAVSTDGYRFTYNVFQGDYKAEDQKLEEESFDWTPEGVVYDQKGKTLKLD